VHLSAREAREFPFIWCIAKSKMNSIVSMLANLSQQTARLDSRNLCTLPTATLHVPHPPGGEEQINIEQVRVINGVRDRNEIIV